MNKNIKFHRCVAFPSVTDNKEKEEQSRQKARQRNVKHNYVQRSLRSESIMSKEEIHDCSSQ